MQVVIDVQTIEDLNDASNLVQHILARRGVDTNLKSVPAVPALSSAPAPGGNPVTTPVPLQPSAEVQFDAEGTPWDERIHSSSRKQTEKGVWARRKNVPDPEFNRVKAELAARGNKPSTPAPLATTQQQFANGPDAVPVSSMPTPAMPIPGTSVNGNPAVQQLAVPPNPNGFAPPPPAAAPAPAAPPMPTPAPIAPGVQIPAGAGGYAGGNIPAAVPSSQLGRPVQWVDVTMAMSQKLADGKVTNQALEDCAKNFGVSPFGMLVNVPASWQPVLDWLVGL